MNDGDPAFPRPALRDWLAGQALTGLLASTANPRSIGPAQLSDEEWAEKAFRLADAMLAAREPRPIDAAPQEEPFE